MRRVIVAFVGEGGRLKVAHLLEQCGYGVLGTYRSGAEVVRTVRRFGGGVAVVGARLTDMNADELAERLSGQAEILVAGAPPMLDLLESPLLIKLPSPISRVRFCEALDDAIERDTARMHARVPKRTAEEQALIDRAKHILMARGFTEPEAHAALQSASMRTRRTLVETARSIVESIEPI